jgi:two-component system, sensor histidine kinase and response regulator
MNLISNAIKFTDEGEITIKTELNKISGKKAIIHFSVTDTGIGIPKNQQDSIFQSFTQADSSTTRRYGGTGLGLSISKQLVELMGGEIWVESPADMSLTSNRRILSENYSGSGSTFHFTAQFHLQSIQERNETLASADIRNISVLVVDDNDTNKVILQQMLKNFKCDPVLVSNGKEALENLDKKEFRLIISDFQMPEMDGAELVGKIRAKYKTPIILLTSIGKTKEFRTLENLGSVVTVSKPVKQSQLYNAITTVLNSSPVKISEKNDKAKLQDKSVTELSKLNKKVKILLAEDNRINQKVALALLKRTGIPVDVASDGNLAVAALKDKKYDLVLMDIQMPNLDGISASQIIRNDLKMPDIPIIAMTAQAMKGDKERCMSAGMNDYISKPISPYQLYNTLLKWINTNHKVQ